MCVATLAVCSTHPPALSAEESPNAPHRLDRKIKLLSVTLSPHPFSPLIRDTVTIRIRVANRPTDGLGKKPGRHEFFNRFSLQVKNPAGAIIHTFTSRLPLSPPITDKKEKKGQQVWVEFEHVIVEQASRLFAGGSVPPVYHDGLYTFTVTAEAVRVKRPRPGKKAHRERIIGRTSPMSAVILLDSTPPDTPPIGLVAIPGDGQVTLTWSPSPIPDLAGYNVYYATSAWTKANPVLITETTYTVSGLQNGVAYKFAVTAVDTAGNESAYSETTTATPAPPAPPYALQVELPPEGNQQAFIRRPAYLPLKVKLTGGGHEEDARKGWHIVYEIVAGEGRIVIPPGSSDITDADGFAEAYFIAGDYVGNNMIRARVEAMPEVAPVYFTVRSLVPEVRTGEIPQPSAGGPLSYSLRVWLAAQDWWGAVQDVDMVAEATGDVRISATNKIVRQEAHGCFLIPLAALPGSAGGTVTFTFPEFTAIPPKSVTVPPVPAVAPGTLSVFDGNYSTSTFGGPSLISSGLGQDAAGEMIYPGAFSADCAPILAKARLAARAAGLVVTHTAYGLSMTGLEFSLSKENWQGTSTLAPADPTATSVQGYGKAPALAGPHVVTLGAWAYLTCKKWDGQSQTWVDGYFVHADWTEYGLVFSRGAEVRFVRAGTYDPAEIIFYGYPGETGPLTEYYVEKVTGDMGPTTDVEVSCLSQIRLWPAYPRGETGVYPTSAVITLAKKTTADDHILYRSEKKLLFTTQRYVEPGELLSDLLVLHGIPDAHVAVHGGDYKSVPGVTPVAICSEFCVPDMSHWSVLSKRRVLQDHPFCNLNVRVVLQTTGSVANSVDVCLSTEATHPQPVIVSAVKMPDGRGYSNSSKNIYEYRFSASFNDVRNQYGLLPAPEDGINEYSFADSVDNWELSSFDDSLTFAGWMTAYNRRGQAFYSPTHKEGNIFADIPTYTVSPSFLQAGGCELLTATLLAAPSMFDRQGIQNQADWFYYSGHGRKNTGLAVGLLLEVVKPEWVWWDRDLDYAILATCAQLDVGNPSGWTGFDGTLGKKWARTGPKVLLGFKGISPRDRLGTERMFQKFMLLVNTQKATNDPNKLDYGIAWIVAAAAVAEGWPDNYITQLCLPYDQTTNPEGWYHKKELRASKNTPNEANEGRFWNAAALIKVANQANQWRYYYWGHTQKDLVRQPLMCELVTIE